MSHSLTLPLVLGSSSVGRQSVLKQTGLPFSIIVADIDEKAVNGGFKDRSRADPEELTIAIAKAKADAILPKIKEPSLLITSDQVVFHDGIIREKPETDEECVEFIKSYETSPACMCSGVVVTNTKTGKQVTGTDITKQYYKPIPDDVIQVLIKEGAVMRNCGGVVIDIDEIQPYLAERVGTFESILGLPVKLLMDLLKQAETD